MKIKLLTVLLSGLLVLTGCSIGGGSSSGGKGGDDPQDDPKDKWEQPIEHGDGNYNYDELETANPTDLVADYVRKYMSEGATYSKMKGIFDVDVYFYNRETKEKSYNVTYPFDEKHHYGPYDLHAVGYLDGKYYKFDVNANDSDDQSKKNFTCVYENTYERTGSRSGFNAMSYMGYDGDYHFTLTPNNKYLKYQKSSFDLYTHINYDNFQATSSNSVYQYSSVREFYYTGGPQHLIAKYYYAPVVDNVIGEYSEYVANQTLDLGTYAMKVSINIDYKVAESKPVLFDIVLNQFVNPVHQEELSFEYKGLKLKNYSSALGLYRDTIKDSNKYKNTSCSWEDPDTEIDFSHNINGYVYATVPVVFHQKNYEDFHSEVTVKIDVRYLGAGVKAKNLTYNGQEQTVVLENMDENILEIDTTMGTTIGKDVGQYKTYIKFKDNFDGIFPGGVERREITWEITKVAVMDYYDFSDPNHYFVFRLEDDDDNIIDCGENFRYNPGDIAKGYYGKIYYVCGNDEKELEIDAIEVTMNKDKLTEAKLDKEKGLLFTSDFEGFYFDVKVHVGIDEDSNFSTSYERIFSFYSTLPYEKTLTIDKTNIDDFTMYTHIASKFGYFGKGEADDDFIYKVGETGDTYILIGLLFEQIRQVEIKFLKADQFDGIDREYNYLHIGNSIDKLSTAEIPEKYFEEDESIGSGSQNTYRDYSTKEIFFNDLLSFENNVYVKLTVGGLNTVTNGYYYIKSITIRYNGGYTPFTLE